MALFLRKIISLPLKHLITAVRTEITRWWWVVMGWGVHDWWHRKPGCGVCRVDRGHTPEKILPAKSSPLIRSFWGLDSARGPCIAHVSYAQVVQIFLTWLMGRRSFLKRKQAGVCDLGLSWHMWQDSRMFSQNLHLKAVRSFHRETSNWDHGRHREIHKTLSISGAKLLDNLVTLWKISVGPLLSQLFLFGRCF